MKHNILICSFLCITLILIPLAVMKGNKSEQPVIAEAVTSYNGIVSVMKTENGRVLTMDEREYLIGSLAAEMNINCHDEALKAQVVACRTYMLYTKNKNLTSELNGADISDDSQVHQGYLDSDARKKKWGENFEEYEKKAGEIVDSVSGKAIYYNNELILAVYHDLNCGKTMSSETVWDLSLPYLSGIESPGDKLSAQYSSETEFSFDEFDSLLKKIDGIKFNKEENVRIGEVNKDENGYVRSVVVFGNEINSKDFRSALGLKSCCFSINENENGLKITTFGNGHMVGMSQYGADYMARQGADYEEILRFYYSNVEIR